MHEAASCGHIDIMKVMIRKGATHFTNIFFSACHEEQIEAAKFIIEKASDAGVPLNYYWALSGACEGGSLEAAKLIIEIGGVKLNEKQLMDQLFTARYHGHQSIVKYLENLIANRKLREQQ